MSRYAAADFGQLSDPNFSDEDLPPAGAAPETGGFNVGAGTGFNDDDDSDDSFDIEAEAAGLVAQAPSGGPSAFYSPGGFDEDDASGSDDVEPSYDVQTPESTEPRSRAAATTIGIEVMQRLEAARQASPPATEPASALPPAAPAPARPPPASSAAEFFDDGSDEFDEEGEGEGEEELGESEYDEDSEDDEEGEEEASEGASSDSFAAELRGSSSRRSLAAGYDDPLVAQSALSASLLSTARGSASAAAALASRAAAVPLPAAAAPAAAAAPPSASEFNLLPPSERPAPPAATAADTAAAAAALDDSLDLDELGDSHDDVDAVRRHPGPSTLGAEAPSPFGSEEEDSEFEAEMAASLREIQSGVPSQPSPAPRAPALQRQSSEQSEARSLDLGFEESERIDVDESSAPVALLSTPLKKSKTAPIKLAASFAHKMLTPQQEVEAAAAEATAAAAEAAATATVGSYEYDEYGVGKEGASPAGSLIEGWEEEPLDDGRVYWWNVETDETTWVRPTKPIVAPIVAPSVAPPKAKAAVPYAPPPLAPGPFAPPGDAVAAEQPAAASKAKASMPYAPPPLAAPVAANTSAATYSATQAAIPTAGSTEGGNSYGGIAAALLAVQQQQAQQQQAQQQQAQQQQEQQQQEQQQRAQDDAARAARLAQRAAAAPSLPTAAAAPPSASEFYANLLPSSERPAPPAAASAVGVSAAPHLPSAAAGATPSRTKLPVDTGGAAGDMEARRQLGEQRIAMERMQAALDQEREAHAQRVARLNQRETELRAREAAYRTQLTEVEATRRQVEDAQREAEWVHWRRDRMRELMRELVTKRPTDEWRRRMERMHTALDLSERDNGRLRAELQKIANAEGGSAVGAGTGGALAVAAVQRGGLHEDLLAKYEAVQLECSQAHESLRLARKAAASQEAYLGVLETEAKEAEARNEAQQRRLETLTAENSKLKKETSKLRSEVTGNRMAAFEADILQQELKGAKDAANAMEAQLARLHTENAALREGGGLKDELAVAHEQLRDSLEAKAEMQIAMALQMRRAYTETKVCTRALRDADAALDGAAAAHEAEHERRLAIHTKQLHAGTLIRAVGRLEVVYDDAALRCTTNVLLPTLALPARACSRLTPPLPYPPCGPAPQVRPARVGDVRALCRAERRLQHGAAACGGAWARG